MKIVLSCFLLVCCILSSVRANSKEELITIATGTNTGIYYPLGLSLCRLINLESAQTGLYCAVESTKGSVDNLSLVQSGAASVGISQADWLHHAFNGTSLFSSVGPNYDLRVIFPLYTEAAVLLVHKESGIRSLDDLVNKRISFGKQGSGPRYTFEEIMKVKGWTNRTFLSVLDFDANEQLNALCNNKIDAAFVIYGFPNQNIKDVLYSCPINIIPVLDDAIEGMLQKDSFYVKTLIEPEIYNTASSIETIGIRSVLFTTKNISSSTVAYISKMLIKNLTEIQSSNESFANLQQEIQSPEHGVTIPIHDGVLEVISK